MQFANQVSAVIILPVSYIIHASNIVMLTQIKVSARVKASVFGPSFLMENFYFSLLDLSSLINWNTLAEYSGKTTIAKSSRNLKGNVIVGSDFFFVNNDTLHKKWSFP